MSKRPTFNDLIAAYGDAKDRVGAWNERRTGPLAESAVEEAIKDADEAREALKRALRKVGVPLDQVAPQ